MRDLVTKEWSRIRRNPNPSYSLIDSQSVKTMGKAKDKGIDGGKKVKGRKLVPDTQGHLVHVKTPISMIRFLGVRSFRTR